MSIYNVWSIYLMPCSI